jgi:cation-transporting ATPase E
LEKKINGLSQQEVTARIAEGKVNTAQNKITKTYPQIVRENVCTLFNLYCLLIAASLASVGAFKSLVFSFIVLANILIGIIQEIHAKHLVESLSLIGAAKATVIRSGKKNAISLEELVLDDITCLELGSQICADSVVIEGEIEVNESLLTGESEPIIKKAGDSLLSGSFVISGSCTAKVIHVGADNFVNQLSAGAKKYHKIHSELLDSMRTITKVTSWFIVPIGILLFAENFLIKLIPIEASIITTAAALLGMLPKGMVLLISTTLIVGIIKMSQKKVLVQELYAIETLAHVDMLCLDKTGTITEGRMKVSNIYDVNSSLLPISIENLMGKYISAIDDNNATFSALRERFSADDNFNLLHKIPFSSERKWSAATFEGIGTIALGAPEKLLGISDVLPTEALNAQKDGKRILCLCYSPELQNGKKEAIEANASSLTANAEFKTSNGELYLVAAIELSDPVRKNAAATLDFFKREGVAIKVISGDNPLTVSSIAKQAGLADYANYIDLSTLKTDEEVMKSASKYSVFGRVSPAQKSLLVRSLKNAGHVVAMTGDGVNDVLALKESDCSIAMAAGADASRQVSKLVLLNSDFTAIPAAVMEGRRVVNGITRFGGVFLVKTFYSVLLSIYFIATLGIFPFVPLQITLYDFGIEAMPTFLLSFEPDGTRLRGHFLSNVINRSMPFSMLVWINIVILGIFGPLLQIPTNEINTAMYFITSVIGLMALFKACHPLNPFRSIIWLLAAAGFFVPALLFGDIVSLVPLHTTAILAVVVLSAVSVPLWWLFGKLVAKAVTRCEAWSSARKGRNTARSRSK